MARLARLAALSVAFTALLACSGSPPAAASVAVAGPPLARRAIAVPRAASSAGALLAPGRPANYDVRANDLAARTALRAPAFAWRAQAGSTAAVRLAGPRDPVAAARAYLGLGLGAGAAVRAATSGPVDEAVVTGVHDLGRGPVIVQLRRQVAGLEVFGERTAVAMTQDLRLVARSGAVPAATRAAPSLRPFALSGHAAIAAALSDLTGDVYAAGDLVSAPSRTADVRAGLADATAAARGARFAYPPRARKLLFPLASDLVPAYRVEVALRRAGAPLLAYGYVISAVDGAVLVRRDQAQSEAFTYRVWAAPADATVDPLLPYHGPVGLAAAPHPTGTPDGYQPVPVAQNLVTVEDVTHGAAHDPWLPAGATQTLGNNVDAYADISGQTGFDGVDFRAATTAARTFSYPYDFEAEPNANAQQVDAAVTQLFYDNNFFHDWYYDAGFDEASGNAQQSNFGRGGEEGDPLHAEAQDWEGFDNANMSTPGDGIPPQMQMFLWTGNGPQYVEALAPAALAGRRAAQVGAFGPSVYDLTAAVAATTPANACDAVTNAGAVTGKIALVDRGACTFVVKVKNAQLAGAVGVILRNVTPAQAFGGMGGLDDTITVPSMLVQLADGAAIGGSLATDAVTVRMARPLALLRDGTIDNLVVAHEWGHFISNRLVGDGLGLESQQAGGLGEGWGDTHALLLAVREADAAVEANASWNGTFGLNGWVGGGLDSLGAPNQGFYFGIRRVPYSTDMQKDPLTFRHIANGEPLVPDGSAVPVAFGVDGADNAEVHNTGEVWATMLWECYAALLRDTQGTGARRTFDQARSQWKDYLVAAYKLTPQNPTLLEARDALLAAAFATDERDFQLFWQAFAKRGAGVGAIGPDRWFSPDNTPVVESYDANPHLTLVSATFEAAASSCSDGDTYLDTGEQGTLHLTVRNDGFTPVPAATATLSADTPSMTFPGGAVAVPAVEPVTAITLDVPVALSARTAPVSTHLTLTFPTGSVLAGATVTVKLVLNQDEVPESSSAEDFQTVASSSVWTVAAIKDGAPVAAGWQRVGETMWGPDAPLESDLRLVSPPLQISDSGDFTLSIRHRYSFESAVIGGDTYFFDGGVIELSQDGGTTWEDVGGDVYDWWVTNYDGDSNPLAGQPAFVGTNPSFPDFDTYDLHLGDAYAGKTVQVRFRIGSDGATASDGWTVDRVGFGGVKNTPFATLHLDAGKCARSSTGGGGGCSTTPGGFSLTVLLLAGAALALRLPRRRRAR